LRHRSLDSLSSAFRPDSVACLTGDDVGEIASFLWQNWVIFQWASAAQANYHAVAVDTGTDEVRLKRVVPGDALAHV